jgi:hypothetical protein
VNMMHFARQRDYPSHRLTTPSVRTSLTQVAFEVEAAMKALDIILADGSYLTLVRQLTSVQSHLVTVNDLLRIIVAEVSEISPSGTTSKT